MSQPELPVNECLSDLVAALARGKSVVLKAPPGAGKTTGVPPVLLETNVCGDGKILLIQPRRLAARSAAARLAKTTGGELGDEVGYHIRFDKKASSQTRLIAMTTGMLLRRLQDDPLLEDVSCVLLDEFHERSLEVDLALGMLQRIRTTLRPELCLVVMSATLDAEPIAAFLDAVPIVSEGRAYPVDVQYAKTITRTRLSDQVAEILPTVFRRTAGHVLVFLPGVGEIRSTRRAIEARSLGRDAVILDLYGDLAPGDQDKVLGESSVRKIILSTNVAETSVTIPGVTAVIDSGVARVLRFDSDVGLPKLVLEPISQASADQRAGRAGRIEPGVCYRLWPAVAHRARRQLDTPEIQRGDLSGAVLTLAAWGEKDVCDFPWLTAPPPASVSSAKTLLLRLDAIEAAGNVTPIGMRMAELPLHPRLSRFMLEAQRLSVVEQASIVAALLTERDPFRGATRPSAIAASDCDMIDRAERITRFMNGEASPVPNVVAAKQVVRVAKQIRRLIASNHVSQQVPAPEVRLKRSLLAAYPDRVARRRNVGGDRGRMVGGRGVKLDRNSVCRDGELFLCIDVDSAGVEATVRAASAVNPKWLDPRRIREVDEPFFSPTTKAVLARRRRYLDDLMLSESPITCQPRPEVAEILFAHIADNLDTVFPVKDKSVASFVDRVRFLCERMPELELPRLDDDGVAEVLRQLCQTRTSVSELQTAPWMDHLRGRYDWDTLQSIEKHAPATMKVPSGNSIAIHYDALVPTMKVRIQELFGWTATPRVAGGRVPVQLHLLGPNYRAQQITDDLQNFWNETYAPIRKELRRRYPKHHWPENPLQATATPRGLKPK